MSNCAYVRGHHFLYPYFCYSIFSNIFAGIRGYIFTIYIEDLTFIIKNDILKTYNNKNLIFIIICF